MIFVVLKSDKNWRMTCSAGLTVTDIEVFEINEAFASQAAHCVDTLQLRADRVNPNGGAIALGHPLGCTGVRLLTTLVHQLKRRPHKCVIIAH